MSPFVTKINVKRRVDELGQGQGAITGWGVSQTCAEKAGLFVGLLFFYLIINVCTISIIIREHFSHVHHISLKQSDSRTSPLLLQVQLRPRAGYQFSSPDCQARIYKHLSNPAPQALSPADAHLGPCPGRSRKQKPPVSQRQRMELAARSGARAGRVSPALSAWATSGPAWCLRAKTLKAPRPS